MWPIPQFTADLVTITEEILNGKLHFFVQCVFVYFLELALNGLIQIAFLSRILLTHFIQLVLHVL